MTKKQLWEYFQKYQTRQGHSLMELKLTEASLQLLLLQLLLNQALKTQFQNIQELRVIVVLAYQILRIDPQALPPYIVLAFVFGLLHEYARAYQILLQAAQSHPEAQMIQRCLKQIKQKIEHPQEQSVGVEMAAVEIAFDFSNQASKTSTSLEKPLELSTLPSLEESLALLEDYQPTQVQRQYEKLFYAMLQKVAALRPESQTPQG